MANFNQVFTMNPDNADVGKSDTTLTGVLEYQCHLLEGLVKAIDSLENTLFPICRSLPTPGYGEDMATKPTSDNSPLVETLDSNNGKIQRLMDRLNRITREIQI